MYGKVRDCKKMFLQTLAIGEWAILNWIKNSDEHCLVNNEEEEVEGEHSPNQHKKE